MIPDQLGKILYLLLLGSAAVSGLLYLALIRIKLEAQSTQCVTGLLLGLIVLAVLISSTGE